MNASNLFSTSVLLLYVWLASWAAEAVVSSALWQLLSPWPEVFLKDPALLERFMTGLGLSVATASTGARFWVGGFIHRLLALGDWRRGAAIAWIFLGAMTIAPAGLAALRSPWLYWLAAVGLAAACHGACWAFENEGREEVRGLRELLLRLLP